MEGDLPEELTAEPDLPASRSRAAQPIVIKDTFSGSSYPAAGRRSAVQPRSPASSDTMLTYNPYKPVRINGIECETAS